jgi:4-deoxy-L-threo-5-hexosulose-uronate ketol-isomerase
MFEHMPAHTMIAEWSYFYFDIQAPQTGNSSWRATKHKASLRKNHSFIITSEWSMAIQVRVQEITFIWGMAGENLDYEIWIL